MKKVVAVLLENDTQGKGGIKCTKYLKQFCNPRTFVKTIT
jgi:hypothetical protein